MEKKMTFNYFYGTEADQFSFYRIPSQQRCLLGVCAEICEAQNPKRNAARIARRKSIHPSYGYLV